MNELKKELSKLSGVDMFNPKFRDVFKKYFPEDKDAEEERAAELVGEDVEDKVEEAVAEEVAEDTTVDTPAEEVAENIEDAKEVEEAQETVENIDEVVTDTEAETIETAVDNTSAELLDAKIENELLKGDIKPEKLNAAKRVMKVEVTSLEDLDKIREILIRDYPEWVRGNDTKGFGMSVDESGDGLTEEEKRLKQMGIDL